MLDHFLEVAYKNETAREESVKLAKSLAHLPVETLQKLASGEVKLSYGVPEDGSSTSWLEKYKDTPFFADAMALEKADLENEVGRSQADAARPQMDHFYQTQDQIRVQKKMLDLKLMETMSAQGMPMPEGGQLTEQITPTAQGAGALGDVAAEGASDGAMTGKSAAAVDLSKAKGLGRLKQLITGDRAKKLESAASRSGRRDFSLFVASHRDSPGALTRSNERAARLSDVADKAYLRTKRLGQEVERETDKVLTTRGAAGAAGTTVAAGAGIALHKKKDEGGKKEEKTAAPVDLAKAKGLGRLKQLFTGDRAKALMTSAEHQGAKGKQLLNAVESGAARSGYQQRRLSGVKDKVIQHANSRADEGLKELAKVHGTRAATAVGAGLGLKAALGGKKPAGGKSVDEKFKEAAVDLKALASGAMNVFKKNPALVSGAVGAAGGALAGGEGHRLQGAIAGGALGVGAQKGISALEAHLQQGGTLGSAAEAVLDKGVNKAKQIQEQFGHGMASPKRPFSGRDIPSPYGVGSPVGPVR